jgi:cell division protease FtsH
MLLAKAVAGQAKVPFFSISGSEFVEMFARRILEERRDVLDRSAKRLLEKETIDEAELIKLIGPPTEDPSMRVAAE